MLFLIAYTKLHAKIVPFNTLERQAKHYDIALAYINLPFVTPKKLIIVKLFAITTKKEYVNQQYFVKILVVMAFMTKLGNFLIT